MEHPVTPPRPRARAGRLAAPLRRALAGLALLLPFAAPPLPAVAGAATATATAQEDGPPSFLEQARAAKAREDWPAIEALARARIAEDAEDGVAHAWLAVALAWQAKFEEGVDALAKSGELLGSATTQLPGLGQPLNEYGNGVWNFCWANFDPAFNRRAWQGLRDRFPGTPWAGQAASRLLMAALKLDDAAAAAPLIAEFEARLAAARDGRGEDLAAVIRQFTEGHLRAGRADARVRDLAAEAYAIAFDRVADRVGYEGPDAPGGDDLAKREACDLDADKEYNALALACALLGDHDPATNPLAAREPEPAAVFTDATEAAGLGGVRRSRVAAADYDDDGDVDLCFQGALFRNDAGVFTDVTKDVGLGPGGASALFGDHDNDGDLDLLLPSAPHARLMRSGGEKGGYRFEDVTAASGLDAITVDTTPEGAAWVDVDRDGWLDVYLAVYENPLAVGHPDRLARNRGDGTFEDRSDDAGIRAGDAWCGRGVTYADYDDDGDVDLYISNYRLQPNRLYRNDGAFPLADVAPDLGLQGVAQQGAYGHTIGSCFGDVDGDGDIDLFCANLAHPRFVHQGFSNLSMLYLNGGPAGGHAFTEARQARGIRFQETHSDPALVDVDNDGDLDLSITCIYEGVPSSLYVNDGRGYFSPATFRARMVAFNGWGQAWFDLDEDGDLDAVIGSGSGVRLFRNEGNDNKWLRVKLAGKGDRPAFGARVTAEPLGDDAPRPLVRELVSARGTTSQDEPVVHFGLGSYKGKVRVTVRWPDTGEEQRTTSFVNRTLTVRQR